ncbi:hypothetical protein DICPUDRAFT_44282 [Dictyostelium purpureum]|uniref:SAYSvFN domain-containing protein n=1 Tax=Dictyostelium purpureum TaxID=5786 RepID=F1A5V1_DICPU|nr:uncharacterized protein DICPUDRAFT_44282 [Dictyostelium purpureum]EGC28428.1 hypothetical protein DICPUDRAFT_44282 [Dictyostelium purpureum]|eukprot:XP_003295045.1 hypothetical protein DICPUDRAFT_44282 [Dictyostelium purpureum]
MSHFQNNPFSNGIKGSSGSYASRPTNNNKRTIIQNGVVKQIDNTSYLRRTEQLDDVDIQFNQFFTKDGFLSIVKSNYKFIIKFLIWLLVQYIFLRLEWGAVFFVLSCFVLIITNLGKRDSNKLSAYNVFNKNYESILLSKSKDSLERDMGRFVPENQ